MRRPDIRRSHLALFRPSTGVDSAVGTMIGDGPFGLDLIWTLRQGPQRTAGNGVTREISRLGRFATAQDTGNQLEVLAGPTIPEFLSAERSSLMCYPQFAAVS